MVRVRRNRLLYYQYTFMSRIPILDMSTRELKWIYDLKGSKQAESELDIPMLNFL